MANCDICNKPLPFNYHHYFHYVDIKRTEPQVFPADYFNGGIDLLPANFMIDTKPMKVHYTCVPKEQGQPIMELEDVHRYAILEGLIADAAPSKDSKSI